MRVRTRKLVCAAIVAVAAGPLAPLPAGAAAPPRARLLSTSLSANGRHFTTGTIEAPGTFDVAGLAYDGPADAEIRLRASGDGHEWTPWYDAGDAEGEGPDRQSDERAAGERKATLPVWTDAARYVQFDVDSPGGAVHNLRLQAVDSQGHGESLPTKLGRHLRGLFRQPTRPAAAMTNQPAIVTRAQWGADERIRRDQTPEYGSVKAAFVHHTVTGNTYSPGEAAAAIRGIYTYHVKSNGWDDIGYNFLVDRYGTIYEGRYGGVDKAVIGAHAEGFNSFSTGTALLGTFTDVGPTPAMLDGVERLLAWKLDLTHVDPQGKVTVTSKGSNRYPEGTQVAINDISGHRDVGQTSCPGNLGYAQLDNIRNAVAGIGRPKFYDLATTAGTVGAPKATDNVPATISARASDPLAWTLTISHYALGEVRHLTAAASATLSANWDGKDDAGLPLPGGTYQVSIAGTGAGGPARSGTVDVVLDNALEPKPAERLAGADRYETAAKVAQQVAPKPTANVVIASGDRAHLVDSLVAAPLAKAKQAPLLLTGADQLPAATTAELDRLQPTDAWVIGGAAAVPDAVTSALEGRGIDVHRLAGDDAPSTAAEVAKTMGAPKVRAFVVAREGNHLVDGLAASGPAAGLGAPVLLVEHDTVPTATADALRQLGSVDLWAVGGASAISDAVVAQLRAHRIAGDDRWQTATAVSSQAATAGVSLDTVVVASGENANLVDALSGGAFGRAVVLSGRGALTKPTFDFLYGKRSDIDRAWILGGTGAIGDSPAADAKHAING